MRSGKRADIDPIDHLDQNVAVNDNSEHLWLENADLGMDLDGLGNSELRRISRSGLGRIRQQAQKQKMNRAQNIWGWNLLLDKRAGHPQFRQGHNLWSGKRTFQDTLQHNAFNLI